MTTSRDLAPDMRGQIADVLGHEAAASGFSRDGRPNRYGDELDALAAMLLDES
jgi:hypothetical protein